MKRTVQQAVTERPVKDDHFEDWVKKEVNPQLKALYQYANKRYSAPFYKTTAATGIYTNIWLDEIPDNSSWLVEVDVVARATTGGAARGGWALRGLFYREGGGAGQQGATASAFTVSSVGAFNVQFAVAGNNVELQVLDDAVRTVAWQAIVWVHEATR